MDKQVDELDQVQHLIDEAVDQVISTWKILANKDCVRLLLTLYTVNITASQAAALIGSSYSLASHDLKLLVDVGLVEFERIDGEKIYKLRNRQVVSDL